MLSFFTNFSRDNSYESIRFSNMSLKRIISNSYILSVNSFTPNSYLLFLFALLYYWNYKGNQDEPAAQCRIGSSMLTFINKMLETAHTKIDGVLYCF